MNRFNKFSMPLEDCPGNDRLGHETVDLWINLTGTIVDNMLKEQKNPDIKINQKKI
jgi:hypothetical protein